MAKTHVEHRPKGYTRLSKNGSRVPANSQYARYDPQHSLRISLILGGMFALFALYLMTKVGFTKLRSHCLRTHKQRKKRKRRLERALERRECRDKCLQLSALVNRTYSELHSTPMMSQVNINNENYPPMNVLTKPPDNSMLRTPSETLTYLLSDNNTSNQPSLQHRQLGSLRSASCSLRRPSECLMRTALWISSAVPTPNSRDAHSMVELSTSGVSLNASVCSLSSSVYSLNHLKDSMAPRQGARANAVCPTDGDGESSAGTLAAMTNVSDDRSNSDAKSSDADGRIDCIQITTLV